MIKEVFNLNKAYENLLKRRSIRKYKPEQLSREELDAVLLAGTYAPTARNRQSPLIVSVQNKADIALMSRLNAGVWGVEFDPFFAAPTIIVVFADSKNKNGVQDASLVMGNLMNAASALGLGSCWVNRAKEVFELPEGRALMEKWGIEGNWTGVGNCTLGYIADPTPIRALPRRDNYVIRID